MLDERRRIDQREFAIIGTMVGASQADSIAALTAVTGVEERDPTADRRVLEIAMRQPEWVRRRDGVPRAVVRGAMADWLPPEIARRTRRGGQLPNWLDLMTAARAELSAEFAELLAHPTSRELLDGGRLQRMMDRWPDRAASADEGVIRSYRLALLRALAVSRYLRWFERRAATRSGVTERLTVPGA